MNPLQQMNLARLDHQERLERAQRNLLVSKHNSKFLFGMFHINLRKANRDVGKASNIKCDTVAVS